MLSDPVAEAFGLIHRHPSGENFGSGCTEDMEEELVSVEDVVEVEDLLDSESELDVLRSDDEVLGRFLR